MDPVYETWRKQARDLILNGVDPSQTHWSDQPDLFGEAPKLTTAPAKATFNVPKEFIEVAQLVACVRNPEKWNVLYRILFKISRGQHDVLEDALDPDVLRAQAWAKSVAKDIHKMHAFVRFKEIQEGDNQAFVAWHGPEHRIVRIATPFFERRFGDRCWSIFTPDESAHWNMTELTFGPGMEQHEFETKDQFDDLWKGYYSAIYNPARLNLKKMRTDMATKYWKSLPEAELIPKLARESQARIEKMVSLQREQAKPPKSQDLAELRAAAKKCEACPLFKNATQTVFGEGSKEAQFMIVGEQPGDQEDVQGHPFVGPAGKILDGCFDEAGIDRDDIWLTNAVKHFKWKPMGKRRLHQKPNGGEMEACRPWLESEIEAVKPKVIVALGATAATQLLGRVPKITKERGQILRGIEGAQVVITWHPSAILRAPSEDAKVQMRQQLIDDLKLAKKTHRIPKDSTH